MQLLVILGAVVTLGGIALLLMAGLAVARARSRGLDDAALRSAIAKAAQRNLVGLGLAAIGLMTVVIGLAFG